MINALLLQRPPVLTAEDLDRIETAMVRILERVGVRVPDDDLRATLAGRGFRTRDDFVCVESGVVRAFLAEERARHGGTSGPAPPAELAERITAGVCPYPQHVHDLLSGRLVPFTVARLTEAVKLVDVLAERGLLSSPPGCPTDVPPALQPVMQYWVAATYSRHGRAPVDPKSEATFPYVAAMAEALGRSIRHLPVYVGSPLTLAGESLTCVLRYRDRLDAIGVNSMAAPGSTAPINIGGALALAAAEVIGPVILLRELLGLPVHWWISIHPVDLGSLAMVFGSPESTLFQLATRELNAHLRGAQWAPEVDNPRTNAKLPGPQACAEKASLMTLGALLGARHFGALGTLSLDEVFSTEQLLYDLEIRDHVQRLVEGLDGAIDPEECVATVLEGVQVGTFAGLDDTLACYRSVYWRPTLFAREFVGGWLAKGARDPREKVHAEIAACIARHQYRLEEDLQREIDRVLAEARAALT
jgi:trimethylamine:corrinoid methyltransferase-like protein